MEQSKGPVTLEGPAWVESFAFRYMQISEGLGEPFCYQLELLSDDPQQDPKLILGQTLTVRLDLGQSGVRHFNGHVTEFSSRGSIGEFFLYRLELRPWLWLLSRTTNCRVFQKLTVPDIVKQIFRLHGVGDFAESLTSSYEAREYVVQYRETDMHFVSRLLEDEGIYFFFRHEANKHTLVLCDSPSAHDATPFYEALPYFPPDQQRREHLDHVDGWEIVHAVQSGGYAMKDFDFENPKAALLATKKVDPGHEQGAFEMFEFPGRHRELGQGERRAMVRLEAMRATATRALGEGSAPGLLVGSLFTLSEFPIEEHNHEYLVISLEATLRTHAQESGAANSGDLFRARFVAIGANQQYRPPCATPKPTVHGVQTAIVVGKAGEEIWTDEFGRVKVKFPWDRYVPQQEENASCWLRVAQLWAGTNFGAMHLPRIGQEVLVEFLEGDPDQPIVVGRVYNFDNRPPYDLPMNQTQSGIKSRSTLGGNPDNFNEIRFEDKKGSEDLFLHAEKTQTTKVKGDQTITVDKSRSISVGGEQSTTVTQDETQTYKANRKMEVTGTNDDTITEAHTGTYKTGRTLTVSGADDVLNVNGVNRSTTVKGKYNVTATDQYQVTNGGNVFLLEGSKASITNGQCTISFDGTNAKIEAPGSIELSCGQSKITLKPMEMTISGVKLSLDGSGMGKLDLEAAGCTLAGPKAKVEGAGMTEIVGAVVKIN